jgi:phospholipase/carboxylesterase
MSGHLSQAPASRDAAPSPQRASGTGAPLVETGEPRGAASRAGVAVHGRGRTADEMIELATRLWIEGARWVAPVADQGSWYPHRFMEPLALNEPFLSEAVERIDLAVSEASEAGRLRPDDLAVVGFSQGACLATEYVLRHPGRCATLIVFTGGLIGPPGTTWMPKGGASLRGLRVLITGSDVDEWVPEARVRETADVLRRLDAEVELRIYHGRAHEVSDEEIAEARELMAQNPRRPGTP